MKKLTLIAAAAFALTLGAWAFFSTPQSIGGTQHSSGTTAMLKVEGMTCSMCPLTIKQALKHVEGVMSVDVSREEGTAKVQYDPKRAKVDDLVRAVENAGPYKANPLPGEGGVGS